MTNLEALKRLFREAREDVKNWPEWMKREEQVKDGENSQERQCSESDLDQRLSA
jgi:hypothetical protein